MPDETAPTEQPLPEAARALLFPNEVVHWCGYGDRRRQFQSELRDLGMYIVFGWIFRKNDVKLVAFFIFCAGFTGYSFWSIFDLDGTYPDVIGKAEAQGLFALVCIATWGFICAGRVISWIAYWTRSIGQESLFAATTQQLYSIVLGPNPSVRYELPWSKMSLRAPSKHRGPSAGVLEFYVRDEEKIVNFEDDSIKINIVDDPAKVLEIIRPLLEAASSPATPTAKTAR